MSKSIRLEIEGLKAIAISAIILYHTQFKIFDHQLFKGGFIGVDIFLVISGYLIAYTILKELISTGTFSFKHFFERRIMRIMPVLLSVSVLTLPLIWLYLLPDYLIYHSKSIVTSISFSSNFYSHYSGKIYGAESELSKLFLHTWSLSVLVQYYICFLFISLIIFKYFKKYLIHILILGFVVSLGLAEWGSKNHPSFTFYLLPTRSWELLAGSILAYFEITNGHSNKNKTLKLILPSIGLLLIGHSILFFNDKMLSPSFYTLSPIIGVCLIIWFSSKEEILTKILSTKLFVGIGLISYSLYLWQYPIFAFTGDMNLNHESLLNKILILTVILITAFISFYYIEKPIKKNNYKFKNFITMALISVIFLMIFNFNIIKNNGYIDRFPILKTLNTTNSWLLLKDENNENCFEKKDFCYLNKNNKNKVYLIGDSSLGSLGYDLNNQLKSKNYQLITSYWSKCLLFPGFNHMDSSTKKIYGNCSNQYFKKVFQILKNEKNSIIILGGRFPAHINSELTPKVVGGGYNDRKSNYYTNIDSKYNHKESFVRAINEIKKNNKVIIIYPVPEAHFPIYKFFNKIDLSLTSTFLTTSYKDYKIKTKETIELFNSINSENLILVKPEKAFCNTIIKNRCVMNDYKSILYYDEVHLGIEGSKLVNNLIMKEIEKIELRSN